MLDPIRNRKSSIKTGIPEVRPINGEACMVEYFFRSKPFGIIASAVILLSALSLAGCGGNKRCVPGGSGESEASPYVICTAAGLAALADCVNAGTESSGRYYQLGNNIDLSTYGAGYNGGKGWKPIGNDTNEFRGHFDGNGKTISNLYIDNISDVSIFYTGLFGYIVGGEVKNLEIYGAYITGFGIVGGVTGSIHSGRLAGCRITGEIKGDGLPGVESTGGVAGSVISSAVTDCYAAGEVSGNEYVGGVAGIVYLSSIVSNSYATGKVSGGYYVGGVAGAVYDRGFVADSYATGEVVGNYHVGGVAGNVDTDSVVVDSYATGGVKGLNYVGGVAGNVDTDSIVANSYATGEVSGGDYIGGVVGRMLNNSILTNSYATIKVSGYEYVGGVTGNVDTDSIVTNSYATGEVSGYEYVGGVAGAVDSSSSVMNCAALNLIIKRNVLSVETTFGRVAGINDGGVLDGNVAFSGMIPGVGIAFGAGTATDEDGEPIDATTAKTQTTYSGAPRNWAFGDDDANPWKWGGDVNANYPLPVLYWQTDAQISALPEPTHLTQ